jgi:cell division transport system permease protein
VSRAVREALAGWRRAPLLGALGIATIAFSLFSLGLFGLVATNIRRALSEVEERVEIRAFVRDSVDDAVVMADASALQRLPEVAQVTYVSPREALERARRELGEFRDVFDAAVLPASLEIRLREGRRDVASVERVVQEVRAAPSIEEVRYGEEWVRKLARIRYVAAVTGLALGIAFALAAAIIVSATIRMAVLARAKEIQIMRLVGATDWYVRLPFLMDGALKGLAGGTLALLLTWAAHTLVSRYVVRTTFFSVSTAALGVGAGALLGLVASALSVGRQLRRVGADRRRWQ